MTAAGRTRFVPMRRCAVCRSSQPRSQLIRFARDEAGQWRLDRERRAGGRGIWVCHESRCHHRKALGRAFRAQAADVADQLAQLGAKDQEETHSNESQNGGIDG